MFVIVLSQQLNFRFFAQGPKAFSLKPIIYFGLAHLYCFATDLNLFEALKEENITLKEETTTLREEITTLKEEISTLKEDNAHQ